MHGFPVQLAASRCHVSFSSKASLKKPRNRAWLISSVSAFRSAPAPPVHRRAGAVFGRARKLVAPIEVDRSCRLEDVSNLHGARAVARDRNLTVIVAEVSRRWSRARTRYRLLLAAERGPYLARVVRRSGSERSRGHALQLPKRIKRSEGDEFEAHQQDGHAARSLTARRHGRHDLVGPWPTTPSASHLHLPKRPRPRRT